jgi:phospholipid/cholesterol/gamma-HCH transport system substrate-binding protein
LGLLLSDLHSLTGQLRKEDGSFQKLLKDPALYQNLDDASFMLVKNLNHLDIIMRDLKVFSDKIARHPGELGVQGVFTKDKGLKTLPPEPIDTSPARR